MILYQIQWATDMKSKTSYTNKHYLHKAYLQGFQARLRHDEWCPHMVGTHEWEWWWNHSCT